MPPWLPLLLIAVLAALLWYRYQQDHTVHDGKYYRLPSGLYERCRTGTFVYNVEDCFTAESILGKVDVRAGGRLRVIVEFKITPQKECLMHKDVAKENVRKFLLTIISESVGDKPPAATDTIWRTTVERNVQRSIANAKIMATLEGFNLSDVNFEIRSPRN